jgi:hypothetical protein
VSRHLVRFSFLRFRDRLQDKDKERLVIPFCCWRYRPSKPYVRHLAQSKRGLRAPSSCTPSSGVSSSIPSFGPSSASSASSVTQPASSVRQNTACTLRLPTVCALFVGLDIPTPLTVEVFDFLSISVALYGLFLLYKLTKDRLRGHKPLAKFLVSFLSAYAVSLNPCSPLSWSL